MFGRKKLQPAPQSTPELPVCAGDWTPAEVAQFRDRLREQTMARATDEELDALLATMPPTPRNTANLVYLYATSITATIRATGWLDGYLATTPDPSDAPLPTDFLGMVQRLERMMIDLIATEGDPAGWGMAQYLCAPRSEPLDQAPVIALGLVRYWVHEPARMLREDPDLRP